MVRIRRFFRTLRHLPALLHAADWMMYDIDHYEVWQGTEAGDIFFRELRAQANEYRKLRFNYDRKARDGDE